MIRTFEFVKHGRRYRFTQDVDDPNPTYRVQEIGGTTTEDIVVRSLEASYKHVAALKLARSALDGEIEVMEYSNALAVDRRDGWWIVYEDGHGGLHCRATNTEQERDRMIAGIEATAATPRSTVIATGYTEPLPLPNPLERLTPDATD